VSQIEHACPSSRPLSKTKLLATTFFNLLNLCKETLGMTKTKIAAVRVKMNRAGLKPDRIIPETTQYLSADQAHVGHTIAAANGSLTGDLWIGTAASTGTREPDKKNVISFRGAAQHHGDNRKLVVESALEKRVAALLMARNDVVELRDQYPHVWWADADGKLCEHTFDFWVKLIDGRRIAIAVKPAARVRSSRVVQKLRQIAAQGIGDAADEVALITDAYATHDAARDAGWKLHARRMRNEAAYREALALVCDMNGVVRFHDLLSGADHPAARRIAIWNLIDEGYLAPLEPGRITDLSWLRRATQN
jgi:hypothetical protein